MGEQMNSDVVIIGAGPSGLVLAIALAHYKVRSTILEKNTEICEDPRAIAMAGDTTRILEVLGIPRSKMEEISQIMPMIQFHTASFTSPPFYSIDQGADWLEQVLPPAIVLLQPGLEKILREIVSDSDYAELRLGCEVTSVEELAEGVKVQYICQNGPRAQLTGNFLVGADGKRGYVRKKHLEAKGIRQKVGIYSYEAAWVAANLYVTLPTPESHPDFPLWKMGYEPDELWDIFWPSGFHFCRHPTMPVATGRFGAKTDKYWRFEYELPTGFQCADPEEHLMEQLRSHLTIAGSRFSRNDIKIEHPVQFPEDCLQILRCEQAIFNNKVVNQWYYNHIALIGDAAHVFPPFGAQGMANGIRDAFGLSWRLGFLLRKDQKVSRQQKKRQHEFLLDSWAQERRQGVDDSSLSTQASGKILLGKSRLVAAVLQLGSGVLEYAPSLRNWMIRKQTTDSHGFRGADDGFFLDESKGLGKHRDGATGGGGKTAQVYMKNAVDGSSSILSDRFFWKTRCLLTLLLLRPFIAQEGLEIKHALEIAELPADFLAEEVLLLNEDDVGQSLLKGPLATAITQITPSKTGDCNGPELLPHYDAGSFRRRFQPGALCALVRPDFIVFSQAYTPVQLQKQLQIAKEFFISKVNSSLS